MESSSSEIEYFAIRDVSQKQIYDSYMGILRISPNKVNGRDVDDPTSILNTLVDFNGVFQGLNETATKNKQINISLTDSDGNLLPIWFIPKAFSREVLLKNTYGNDYSQKKSIINIVTKVDDGGITYISNSLTNRSSLILSNPQENRTQLVFALGCTENGDSPTINCQSILMYPIEAPNDDEFFNNKNKFNLFDPKNVSKTRAEQMEEKLLQKTAQWYHLNNLFYSKHHVKVNGEFINQYNIYNEQIPVLYTHDYVLGHYDGHVWNEKNFETIKKNQLRDGTVGLANLNLKDGGRATKLSWLRIDTLVWQYLEQILKGTTRHYEGRYEGLGMYNNQSITKYLFNISNISQQLKENSVILGQGHQNGLVSYHAMPFHRYWFHRCRQLLFNYEDAIEKSTIQYKKESQIQDLDILLKARNDGKITACCDATVSPHHSLVKDFIICDGKEIDFSNYPNISLKNYNLLNVNTRGEKARLNSSGDIMKSQIGNTIHTVIKSTPQLYVFDERYPRFIRSLNWNVEDKGIENYKDSVSKDCNYYFNHSREAESGQKNHSDENFNVDTFGEQGLDIKKPITDVKVYDWNVEFKTQVFPHQHKLFSSVAGKRGPENYQQKQVQIFAVAESQTVQLFDRCLWANPNSYYEARGAEWLKYSFHKSKLVFDNYTPVPNGGMMFLNAELYNCYKSGSTLAKPIELDNQKYAVSTQSVPHRGTIAEYEGNWSSSGFSYLDAKGKEHKLDSNTNIISHKNVVKVTTPEASVILNHKMGKKKRQLLAVKMNQAEALLPISYKGYAQFAWTSHHLFYWHNDDDWWDKVCNFVGDFLSAIPGVNILTKFIFKNVLGDWLNLDSILGHGWAEGIVGLGFGLIGATQYHYYNHGNDQKIPATGTTKRYNIGNYTLAEFNVEKIYDESQSKYSFQCLSSLPYPDQQFLAVGDIEKIKTSKTLETYYNLERDSGEDFFVAHNVTDRWNIYNKDNKTYYRQKMNYTQKFDGEQKEFSDINGPFPSHINLIPIIKI